jgi:Ca-activated chloride channel family protein
MRRAIAILLLVCLPSALSAQMGSDAPTIRVRVQLVSLPVNVTDQNGATVGGLERDDFTVLEDGRPQRIAVFEKEAQTPLSVVLAVDTSLSVHKDMRIEQDAARAFVRSILREQDQISVLQFEYDVRELVGFTNSERRIDAAIEQMRSGTATALYDAVELSSELLEGKPGRRVIVIVTDGGNTVKGTSYRRALDSAVRAQAVVYSIILVPIAASAGRDTGGEHALIQLSNDSGGRYYYVEQTEKLPEVFRNVSDDLRAQYLLGYYSNRPSTESEFRTIQVKLNDAQRATALTLRHRTGYYTTPSPVPPR